MVEEHEADRDGSDDEEDDVEELEAPRRVLVHERRRALRRRDVDETPPENASSMPRSPLPGSNHKNHHAPMTTEAPLTTFTASA